MIQARQRQRKLGHGAQDASRDAGSARHRGLDDCDFLIGPSDFAAYGMESGKVGSLESVSFRVVRLSQILGAI